MSIFKHLISNSSSNSSEFILIQDSQTYQTTQVKNQLNHKASPYFNYSFEEDEIRPFVNLENQQNYNPLFKNSIGKSKIQYMEVQQKKQNFNFSNIFASPSKTNNNNQKLIHRFLHNQTMKKTKKKEEKVKIKEQLNYRAQYQQLHHMFLLEKDSKEDIQTQLDVVLKENQQLLIENKLFQRKLSEAEENLLQQHLYYELEKDQFQTLQNLKDQEIIDMQQEYDSNFAEKELLIMKLKDQLQIVNQQLAGQQQNNDNTLCQEFQELVTAFHNLEQEFLTEMQQRKSIFNEQKLKQQQFENNMYKTYHPQL